VAVPASILAGQWNRVNRRQHREVAEGELAEPTPAILATEDVSRMVFRGLSSPSPSSSHASLPHLFDNPKHRRAVPQPKPSVGADVTVTCLAIILFSPGNRQ
jgi:hypothetical protein